jgi:hypothetical protein
MNLIERRLLADRAFLSTLKNLATLDAPLYLSAKNKLKIISLNESFSSPSCHDDNSGDK